MVWWYNCDESSKGVFLDFSLEEHHIASHCTLSHRNHQVMEASVRVVCDVGVDLYSRRAECRRLLELVSSARPEEGLNDAAFLLVSSLCSLLSAASEDSELRALAARALVRLLAARPSLSPLALRRLRAALETLLAEAANQVIRKKKKPVALVRCCVWLFCSCLCLCFVVLLFCCFVVLFVSCCFVLMFVLFVFVLCCVLFVFVVLF